MKKHLKRKSINKYILLPLILALCLSNTTVIPSYFDNFPVKAYASEQIYPNPFPLILDCDDVDYMSYIPEITAGSRAEAALSISNPEIAIEASAAVLLKSDGTVLYHKNATKAVFPASTAKLLNALVVIEWCKMEEQVTVGREVGMLPEDSSKAGLKKGQVLTVWKLMNGLLLPSGNDSAYVLAAYVGRKSLKNPKAGNETAIKEFVRLMNAKAVKLGAENSCFITPDGYDAIGQYTTAYDMARIALRASKSNYIKMITKYTKMSVTLSGGTKLTWTNTNQLLDKKSIWYNPKAIGMKTGTTEMAGKCLISAAANDLGTVICVVMDSTTRGRWNDSNKLLNYGLKNLE